jgi:hypothetical protein
MVGAMHAHLGLLYGATTGAILLGAGALHVLPRFGRIGRSVAAAICRAPLLDLVLFAFTALPAIAGAILRGWAGLGVAIAAQVTALLVWVALHELAHPAARRGPRIVGALARIAGPWRNHAALWWMTIAVPAFWVIRLAQYLVYPVLVRLVRLPRVPSREWVSLSRHKFDGLVGYDLIWCLYCDWMTGIWSLGSEMLRNIESFWCPIRFSDATKCERCRREFPDVDAGWVASDGTMSEVVSLIEARHGGGFRGWFGHPARLTVRGAALEDETGADASAR